MIRRHLLAALDAALRDTPVALLVGPRQAGKSTLARQTVAFGPQLHEVPFTAVWEW